MELIIIPLFQGSMIYLLIGYFKKTHLNPLIMKHKIKFIYLFIFLASLIGCDDSLSVEGIDSADKKNPTKVQKDNTIGATEWTNQVPVPCKEVCLVAGQHMYTGTVDVAEVAEGLVVTYNITEPGVYLEEVHLDIFSNIDDFKSAKKISNGGAIPGKFEYKMSWSANEMVTTHSVLISNEYIETVIGTDLSCLFIASHAALSNGETAWGGLCNLEDNNITNLDDAKQFPGANWSVYFEFCQEECTESINFTYAWEDLQNNGNDGDYNDLVIQSDIIKSSDEVKITFLAKARGAAFEHQFKFKIPKTGIISIFGGTVVDDGANYIVTVFESTKAVLPNEGSNYANTALDDDTCTPNGTAEVIITINEKFEFDSSFPYEPFITVTPYTSYGGPYDLYIYEVSGRDTWLLNGKEYPNGIIISSDWKWPLERAYIGLAYPDFKSLTDGWNPSWSDNLGDPSKVFTCN